MLARRLILIALALAIPAGAVMADELVFVTPPLYREQARTTAAVRPASELTTTPSLVRANRENSRIVAEASDMSVR